MSDAKHLPEHAPRTLKGFNMRQALGNRDHKQTYVTTMFHIIAPRYVAFTVGFSGGMDPLWKRTLVNRLAAALPENAVVADIACGTGDLALSLAQKCPTIRVIGIDPTPGMIQLARQRATAAGLADRVSFELGDMMQLEFADNSLDAVTMGYGLRNAPDHRGAIRELWRVLKPGGLFANLDFARPRSRWWRTLYLGYLRLLGGIIGAWLHGDPAIYGYIARSIDQFISWQDLVNELEENGFRVPKAAPQLGGGICRYEAVRS